MEANIKEGASCVLSSVDLYGAPRQIGYRGLLAQGLKQWNNLYCSGLYWLQLLALN